MIPALLIVDVQTLLCEGEYACFDVARVIERINALAASARSAGAPVVVIQHQDAGPLKVNTDAWRLDSRLAVLPDDIYVHKTVTDAFQKTNLDALLKARGVDTLVVCGLQSEFCVDSTVRGALAHGYRVLLVSDAHSTIDNGVLSAAQISAHHNVTLSNIDSFGPRATPVPAAEIRFDRASTGAGA